MLGSGGVGKTSLTLMFVRGEFVEQYVPTIEDEFQKNIKIDDETYQACIVDTAGQDEFKDIKNQAIRQCDGFVLVYAVDDESSVEAMKELFEMICQYKGNNPKVIILGNKCDLPKTSWKNTKEEVKSKISSWGSKLPIVEVSAKAGIGVNESFEKISRVIAGKDNSGSGGNGDGCCNVQ